ncbi:hypothetical protein ACIHJG_40445 [Streptomyces sp. NPDC052415]
MHVVHLAYFVRPNGSLRRTGSLDNTSDERLAHGRRECLEARAG